MLVALLVGSVIVLLESSSCLPSDDRFRLVKTCLGPYTTTSMTRPYTAIRIYFSLIVVYGRIMPVQCSAPNTASCC